MDFSQLIVVKVGSQLMASSNAKSVERVAAQMNGWMQQGKPVVLISSGAVSLGKIAMQRHSHSLHASRDRAVYASVGQDEVIRRWKHVCQYPVGQVLVDKEHLSHRKSFNYTHQLIRRLLSQQIIPIINENDTLNFGAKSLGNNDALAAHIAVMLNARWLMLVTDVAGIFQDYPVNLNRIPCIGVDELNTLSINRQHLSEHGTGGMVAKIEAAQLAAHKGVETVIGNDTIDWNNDLLAQNNATYIVNNRYESAERKRFDSSKIWLKASSEAQGALIIDAGATLAITERGASLLFPGIKAVEGNFNERDVVDVLNEERQVVAKGFCRFSAKQLVDWQRDQNKRRSNDRLADERQECAQPTIVIHRNDMAIIDRQVSESH